MSYSSKVENLFCKYHQISFVFTLSQSSDMGEESGNSIVVYQILSYTQIFSRNGFNFKLYTKYIFFHLRKVRNFLKPFHWTNVFFPTSNTTSVLNLSNNFNMVTMYKWSHLPFKKWVNVSTIVPLLFEICFHCFRPKAAWKC